MASVAFADADVVTLPLARGRYVVRHASLTPENPDGDELAPLLWFEPSGK